MPHPPATRTTRTAPAIVAPRPSFPDRDRIPLPNWVRSLFSGEAPVRLDNPHFTIQQFTAGRADLFRLQVHDARALSAARFQERVAAAYSALQDALTPQCPHVVRFWNYLPAIRDRLDAERDRYMVFNAGRFPVFEHWFGGGRPWSDRLPAATAVGHAGDDLFIDALATALPGVAVENPRQTPAVQYTREFGPIPPCFARGCRINAGLSSQPKLLISGTASIRGQATMHPQSLLLQLRETWLNLRTLLDHAGTDAIESLRVYHPDPLDAAPIHAFLSEHAGDAVPVEYLQADLCRADLRVEIEAVANVAQDPA